MTVWILPGFPGVPTVGGRARGASAPLVARVRAAAEVLGSLGISLGEVRQQVEEIIGWGHVAPSGPLWFTPRAGRALRLAQQEALASQDHTGTGHLLVGLTCEGDGIAVQVLVNLGANLNWVRRLARGRAGPDPAA